MAGSEAGLIIGVRHARSRDVEWPATLMAVMSTVLLSAGVLRHYWDIYKQRTVRGISFIFVGIDAAGDVFSLLSVFFEAKPNVNVLGVVIYSTEFILWCGVFACGGYFNLLPWLRQRWSIRERKKREIDRQQSSLDDREQQQQQQQSDEGGISMRNDLPSSTSVFRTPSISEAVSRRTGVGNELEITTV
ncbi:hypothetical protein MMC12_000345 [Toensbergia leucococca]|nr:hypothetical protein [Toensbergia leucococca]